MTKDPEYNFDVDVERPNRDTETMSFEEAEDKFHLDHIDSRKLKLGKVVFVGETAISRTSEEEENKKENE